MLHWYALYTKSRQEGVVAGRLGERELEVFYPCYAERRRGKAPVVRPLFPGYLFTRFDLDAAGLAAVSWTPGLRYLLSFAGVPARVPEEAIALVRKRLAQVDACGSLPRPRFRPGEAVRIVSGPLAGLEAVFDRSLGPRERVQVLVHFLGEVNRAEVSLEALEPGVEREQRPSRGTRGRGRPIGRP